MKRELYKQKTEKGGTEISVRIQENGDLVVDGCDWGKDVEDWHGDFDYEYYITVKAEHKALFLQHLQTDAQVFAADSDLLDEILQQFAGSGAYHRIKSFLAQHNIPFTTFIF